jgi:hypothetical protein
MNNTAIYLVPALLVGSRASAQTADFDTFPEGSPSTVIVDGGITFSNMNNGLGGTPNFVIEQADGTLTGMPGFTTPMTLGFGGYSPGPGAAFSRIISFDITPSQGASAASLQMFEFGSYAGNTITLQALAGATVVASQTITIPSGFAIHHYAFSVSGASFDHLHVLGAGPQDNGAFFALVDHVVIAGEPGTPFCPGDGTGPTPCPCANSGASDHGCNNSIGTGGAELAASGTTSPDTVVLTSSDELASSLSIFLQGTVALATPVSFGDGVRCVGGVLKRLYVKNASSGTAFAPDFAGGDPSITTQSAALGDPIPSGATRFYQVYYRDPSTTFCPAPIGNTFNVSNGRSIVW